MRQAWSRSRSVGRPPDTARKPANPLDPYSRSETPPWAVVTSHRHGQQSEGAEKVRHPRRRLPGRRMALRSVPGVQPGSAREEPAETLPGAATAHRGARRRPPAPRAATVPRSPARACEVLDDVPTVSSGPSRSDVQARRAEVTWSRNRAAPGSDSGSKRGLARGSSVLPDAHSGGFIARSWSDPDRVDQSVVERFAGVEVAAAAHVVGDVFGRAARGLRQPSLEPPEQVAVLLALRGDL